MFMLPDATSSSTSCCSSLSSPSSRAKNDTSLRNVEQHPADDKADLKDVPCKTTTYNLSRRVEEECGGRLYTDVRKGGVDNEDDGFVDSKFQYDSIFQKHSEINDVIELLESSSSSFDDNDNLGEKSSNFIITKGSPVSPSNVVNELLELSSSTSSDDDNGSVCNVQKSATTTKEGSTLPTSKVLNPYKKAASSIKTGNETESRKLDKKKMEAPRNTGPKSNNGVIKMNTLKVSAIGSATDRPAAQTIHYNIQNRPLSCRVTLPVSYIFHNKLSSFLLPSFWPYSQFNNFQSEMIPAIFDDPNNICISAPTGAGKTGCFEMCIIHLYQQVILKQSLGSDSVRAIIARLKMHKILYIAPNKALCEERCAAWTKQFALLTMNEKDVPGFNSSISCIALTGDYYQNNDEPEDVFKKIQDAHIIIATPEKWDSLTRRWKENLNILQLIKLLLLDEVHLLGDSGRGCCLETVICRMKMVQNVESDTAEYDELEQNYYKRRKSDNKMRIAAVSATLPNCDDIAYFLECPFAHVFDGSYRPVPLTVHVISCGAVRNNNQFLFDKSLNAKVPAILQEYSNNKPAIVFCHSKKETEILASDLMKNHFYSTQLSQTDTKSLALVAKEVSTLTLKKCLFVGVAFHHAGMEPRDRQLVENAFASGVVKCLFATSTLAMGVNLPAHLVVIKGTTMWRGTGIGYAAIDSGTLLQMMGRSGRPGYDTSGTAVIMTDVANKAYYENFGGPNAKPIESQLLGKIVEKVNIEISQRVIQNSVDCVRWLKSTFYFARAIKHPKKYGVKGLSKRDMEEFLMETCKKALEDLESFELVRILEDRSTLLPNVASHIMSHHLVDFESMKRIMTLAHDSGPFQLLETLSQCGELQYPVRRNEKALLSEAHKMVKHKLALDPGKFKVQKPSQKAFILLQASIGQHYIEDFTLRQEMTQMVDIAQRLLKAIEDFSVQSSRHGAVALESFLMRRSFATSLWGPSDGVLNQLRGVGERTTKKMAEKGISTFLDVMAHSNQSIEQAAGRHDSFGQSLRLVIAKIFRNALSLSAFIENGSDVGERIVCRVEKCSLDTLPNMPQAEEVNIEDKSKAERVVDYTLIAHTDRKGGLLMFHRDISSPGEYILNCPANFGRINVHLVSNLVGLDNRLSLDGTEPIESTLFASRSSNASCLSSKKNNKKATSDCNSNREKRAALAEKQHEMVNEVHDVRMLKKNRPCSISPAAPPEKAKASVVSQSKTEPEVKKYSSFVTPSPHCERTHQCSKHDLSNPSNQETVSSEVGDAQIGARCHNVPKDTRAIDAKQAASLSRKNDSWQEKKRRQTSLQEGSYGAKPKQNPFSAFKFDPNTIEARLDSLSNQLISTKNGNSIIPLDFTGHNFTGHKSSHCSIRTPAKSGLAHSVGLLSRRKPSYSRSGYIDERDLLGMKAAEQNAYSVAPHMKKPILNIATESQILHNDKLNIHCNNGFTSISGPTRSNYRPTQLRFHQYPGGDGTSLSSASHFYQEKENDYPCHQYCLPTSEAFPINGQHNQAFFHQEPMPIVNNRNNPNSISYYNSIETPFSLQVLNYADQGAEANHSNGGYDANGQYHSQGVPRALYQRQQFVHDNGVSFNRVEHYGNRLYTSNSIPYGLQQRSLFVQSSQIPTFNNGNLYQNKCASMPIPHHQPQEYHGENLERHHDYFAALDGMDSFDETVEADELLGCNIICQNHTSAIDDILEQAFF